MLFSSFPAFKLFLIRLGQQFLLDRMRTWCLFGLRPDAQCTLALVDFNRVILGLRWDNIFFIEWLVVFFIERLWFYDFMRSQDDVPFLFCFKCCNSIFLESRICLRQISTSAPGTCLDAFRWAASSAEAREVHYPTSTPWWCVERRLQWLPSDGPGSPIKNTIKYVPCS